MYAVRFDEFSERWAPTAIAVLRIVTALLFIAGQMAVAYWMVHAPQSPFPLVNNGEAAILYCFIFLLFVAIGPGTWSVDKVRARHHSDIEGYAAPGGERS